MPGAYRHPHSLSGRTDSFSHLLCVLCKCPAQTLFSLRRMDRQEERFFFVSQSRGLRSQRVRVEKCTYACSAIGGGGSAVADATNRSSTRTSTHSISITHTGPQNRTLSLFAFLFSSLLSCLIRFTDPLTHLPLTSTFLLYLLSLSMYSCSSFSTRGPEEDTFTL